MAHLKNHAAAVDAVTNFMRSLILSFAKTMNSPQNTLKNSNVQNAEIIYDLTFFGSMRDTTKNITNGIAHYGQQKKQICYSSSVHRVRQICRVGLSK